ELSSSWQRSTNSVDPIDNKAPRILTPGELKESREPLGKLISTAQEELDRLYKVVREAGYTILFCDSAGVAIEHRGEATEASDFEYCERKCWLRCTVTGRSSAMQVPMPLVALDLLGPDAAEPGLNLSCSGAPIFGVDGRLLAVLDVSAIDP